MKYLICILIFVSLLDAESTEWKFERLNYYFENDIFSNTDSEYTDGSRLSVLMYRSEGADEWLHIPFTISYERAHFISFSLTQAIYTPKDLSQRELIVEDRPYAGWLYFEMGLHQSSEHHLNSLSLQVGVVGPASGMERLQGFVHKMTDSNIAQGWDNQLNNEIGLQLNYQHKWRYVSEPLWGVESSLVPYLGGEFGNVAIKANVGTSLRLGWNIPEDFGSSTIDEGGENGIPVRTRCLVETPKPWSFNFYLAAGGTAVARDLFLDGNTFSESHSVNKQWLKAYGALGLSGRYKNVNVDYIQTYHTKQYEEGTSTHSIGSIIISYLFSS